MQKRSSNTLIILLALILAIILAVTVAFLVLENKGLFVGSKVEVSNLHFSPSKDWKNTVATFTITNVYTSKITVIGSEVNQVKYGYSDFILPPGQTKNATINLEKIVITKCGNYTVDLTVTFEDGQYEIYSQNYVPPKYTGASIVENISMSLLNDQAFLSLDATNTGNIPLKIFKITVGSSPSIFTLANYVMPQDNLHLEKELLTGTFHTGISYPILYEFVFADESTFTGNSSVIFS